MTVSFRTIRDVAERQLCCGCGVCAYLSPDEIEMVDTRDYGRRPLLREGAPRDRRSGEAMRACPGIRLEHTFDPEDPALIPELTTGWGPVREIWEGYAADPEIRFAGSSGGAASALALFCIERLGFHGFLHIAARPDLPYLNHTVLSTTRAEIFAATGSRYAPASPCDRLQMIEDAPGPCAFIGKPCDVAGLQAARRLRPELDRKVGLTIAIFCAGTPTTRATLALLARMGVSDPASVISLRYRGNGWPGNAAVRFRTPAGIAERELTYAQSWGEVLTNDKQWRCNLCPDHTGEFADIAVGDPWYREIPQGEPGRSLVLARTERGQRILRTALAAGYLSLARAAPAILPASQPNLLQARGAVWGRILALRVVGLPTPARLSGVTFKLWWKHLSIRARIRSLVGTLRRVIGRALWRRHPVTAMHVENARTCPQTPEAVEPGVVTLHG